MSHIHRMKNPIDVVNEYKMVKHCFPYSTVAAEVASGMDPGTAAADSTDWMRLMDTIAIG